MHLLLRAQDVLRLVRRLHVPELTETEEDVVKRTFRQWIRPAILALLRALPSPEKCGCQARKEWMIKQIQAI